MATVNHKPTLLAVLAHPDDETFGMGGTLALYANRGVTVHLICATNGEAGEADEVYLKNFASMADLRKAELRCASRHLGLKGVHFLNYRDSGMSGSPDNQHPDALAAAPVKEVAEKIIHHMNRIQPQVVLTFDPAGGYQHPDHVSIHKATVMAFDTLQSQKDKSAYIPQKLYYQNFPRGFVRVLVRIMQFYGKDPEHFGRNRDINLQKIAEVDFPNHAVINYRSVFRNRNKASACHASQGGQGMSRGIIGWLQILFAREMYIRAHPLPPPRHIERDLFEGITFTNT